MIEKKDIELIRRIQTGDIQAEKQLITQFRMKIVRQVRSKLSNEQEEWQDIVSEIQMAVLISIRDGKYDPQKGVPLGSYIYGITMNKIRDYFKAQKKQSIMVSSDLPLDSFGDAVEEFDFEKEELKKVLRNRLKTLKLKYQEVLYLRYFEELSINEISEKINLQPRRVSERINYALKLLRKKIEKGSFFSIFLYLMLINI